MHLETPIEGIPYKSTGPTRADVLDALKRMPVFFNVWDGMRDTSSGTKQVDSISIRGLTKAHLRQLAAYIRDESGWYHGHPAHLALRHTDLLEMADELERLATDPDICIAKGEQDGSAHDSP